MAEYMIFQATLEPWQKTSEILLPTVTVTDIDMPLTPPPDSACLLSNDTGFGGPLIKPSESPKSPEESVVAVIGVGYVGLHLVESFSKAYRVIGYDIDQARLDKIAQNFAQTSKRPQFTTNPADLSAASHLLISVSTTLTSERTVDNRHVESAIATAAQHARPGATIVLESSVAIGDTRKLLTPLLQRGYKCGMSPERVDPGRMEPALTAIPKIISGLDGSSLDAILDLYKRVFDRLVPVSNPETAEMTKLYENCQRMMCIAYANEMADACRQYKVTHDATLKGLTSSWSPSSQAAAVSIDPFEVARVAATKPFGYMPCTPSAGVGGHCIPVNPYYLLSTSQFPLLQACTERMASRPARLADEIMSILTLPDAISDKGRSRKRVLVVGMGFKRGQNVLCYSPGEAIAKHLLSAYNTYVEFADPLVTQEQIVYMPRLDETSSWTLEYLSTFDAVVVAVNQTGLDFALLDALEQGSVLIRWLCERPQGS